MSGSDKYLSMSLDDIIKLQRKQKTRGSTASNSSRGHRANFNQRGQQRNYQQQRGRFNNRRGQQQRGGRLQQQGSRQGFRGNQRQGLHARGGRQSVNTQRGRPQQQRQWQPRQQRQQGVNTRPSLTFRQNNRSRGRRGVTSRQALVTRGGAKFRVLRQVPQRQAPRRADVVTATPRGPQRLTATQLARNRVRLAAQILMQRRQQLQHLQTGSQGGPVARGGLARRRGNAQLRRNQMTASHPAATFSTRGARRGARRGALLNRINARATVMQKIARASRNRQNNSQAGTMLSVNIENERALLTPVFEMPAMVVVNDLSRDTRPPPVRHLPNVRAGARPMQSEPPYRPELQVEASYVAPNAPKGRLTLHERFATFQ